MDIEKRIQIAMDAAFSGRRTDDSAQKATKRIRAAFKRNEVACNPFGASNSKTNLPGTYRPVGHTCHDSCPFFQWGEDGEPQGPCYALYSYAGMIQRRASAEVYESVTAAIAVIVAAAFERTYTANDNLVARLHVSGDFYTRNNEVDTGYIKQLIEVGNVIKKRFDIPEDGSVAYTYTHHDITPGLLRELRNAGIVVLRSDAHRAGGAVVHSFDKLDELKKKNPGVKYAKCLAQLTDFTCRDCSLCRQSYEKGICIVFDPHGAGKEQIK